MNVARPLISPTLIGRDALVDLGSRRIDEAGAGRGGLLFLAGEAGIGKTRLLDELEQRALDSGLATYRGAAFPRDISATAGVFLDLARDLSRHGALADVGQRMNERLASPGASGDVHHRHRLLVLDVVDLLASVATPGPALIALEDIHWADDVSLEILATLARRLPEVGLLVVATYRSDELYPRTPIREWRARLLNGRLAEEVRLPRLSLDETGAMAAHILASTMPAPAEVVAAIHERTDGVPLYVEELVSCVVESGPGADAGRVRSLEVPDTLDEAILRRAERLSPEARRIAEAACVIGQSFDIDLLAATAELPAELLSGPLDELESQFFVVRSGGTGRYDFRHALIRDALYFHVPIPARRVFHGCVADATLGDGRFGPAFRSIHLEEAGRRDEAFAAAVAGGRAAAAMSAHREARGLFERARRVMPRSIDPTDRAKVLEDLADTLAATDDNEAAASAFVAARDAHLEAGDRLGAASIAPRLAAVRHLLGDSLQQRAALLRYALDEVEGAAPGDAGQVARGRILAGLSAAFMLDRRLPESIEYGEAGQREAHAAGDEDTELHVAATVGSCYVFAGGAQTEAGWSLLDRTVRRAVEARHEFQAARAYRMVGSSASVLVEYERAERALTEGIEYAERVELWNDRHYMAAHLAHVRWATGDLEAARRIAEHALADGHGATTRITALHVLGYVHLVTGDYAHAIEILGEARALGERMAELQRLSPALWGLAEAALRTGRLDDAAELCEQGRAASGEVHDAAYLFPFLVTGVRVHLAWGDTAAARTWFRDVSRQLVERSIPGTLPAVDHARGLLELVAGRTGRARASLSGALEGWEARNRRWDALAARLDLAACLARSNRSAEALELARSVGEWTREVAPEGPHATEAAALVGRLSRRGGAASAGAPGPLTAREIEVARLIARGMTNAEIASELGIAAKTVAAHVEHSLAKLGASRRTEIAAWAMRQGRA